MILLPDDIPDIFFESSELPTPPPPTLFYGLEPYGVGTGECESLKSYICRLADKHRVSLKSFFTDVISEKMITDTSTLNNPFSCSMKNNQFAITMGKVANDLVMFLINATDRSELVNCTLLPLINIISINAMFSSGERHCPACLIESNSKRQIYGHLLWAIKCVNTCPKHKINLVPSICGAFEDKQRNAANKKILWGVCASCGSVAYLCRKDELIKSSDIEVWKAQQIAELISCFPVASSLFSKSNLIKGLNLVIMMAADGKSAIAARQAGINKSVLWGWLHGYFAPRLSILLELCLAARVSLVSVMKGLPIECDSPIYETRIAKERIPKPTIEVRENALRNALNFIPAKSLSEVSKELGLSSRILCDNFPDLTSTIVENYKNRIASQNMEHEKKIQEMGNKIMQELIRRGLSLSLRNFQMIAGKVVMPDSRLHNFWKKYRITELEKANEGKSLANH